MEKQTTLVLMLAMVIVTNGDNQDLDDNVVAKMIVGFAQMMNLTSAMVCLPTPKSAGDPLPIFVQDVNISLALQLTWKQYNNYSWIIERSRNMEGYTYIVYSWSPGTVNASSVWDVRCNYTYSRFLPTNEATEWSVSGTEPCSNIGELHGELLNIILDGALMFIPYNTQNH